MINNDWHRSANCREYPTEIFFTDTAGWSWENRKAVEVVCSACPVASECLLAALREEQDAPTIRFGIRGGMTAHQRQQYWNDVLFRRAGWCPTGMHLMENDDEECSVCKSGRRSA